MLISVPLYGITVYTHLGESHLGENHLGDSTWANSIWANTHLGEYPLERIPFGRIPFRRMYMNMIWGMTRPTVVRLDVCPNLSETLIWGFRSVVRMQLFYKRSVTINSPISNILLLIKSL